MFHCHDTQPLMLDKHSQLHMHKRKHTVLRRGDYLAKLSSLHPAGVLMLTCCLRFRLGPLEGSAPWDTCGWTTTPLQRSQWRPWTLCPPCRPWPWPSTRSHISQIMHSPTSPPLSYCEWHHDLLTKSSPEFLYICFFEGSDDCSVKTFFEKVISDF